MLIGNAICVEFDVIGERSNIVGLGGEVWVVRKDVQETDQKDFEGVGSQL